MWRGRVFRQKLMPRLTWIHTPEQKCTPAENTWRKSPPLGSIRFQALNSVSLCSSPLSQMGFAASGALTWIAQV